MGRRYNTVTKDRIVLACVTCAVLMGFSGCEEERRGRSREPDALEGHVVGGEVVVPPEQQQAIGLKKNPAEVRELRDAIRTTGWLVARPGSEVVVRAPLTGFVAPPKEANAFSLGRHVSRDETMARLQVFLSPQEEAQLVAAKEDADTVIRQSLASLKIAREQLRRLERESVPVVRETRLQELREIVARAQAAYDEAQEKLPFLPSEPYGEKLKLREVLIPAPRDGNILRVDVAPGQLVLQGDRLWTVADWSKLWIRVPVFVADLPRIRQRQAVRVVSIGTRTARDATPVEWPQASRDGRQTVDLFYEIDNAQRSLRPGQAVEVTLPLSDKVRRLVIPQTAILWGDDGSAAVYVQTAVDHFRRRKVVLGRLVDELVVVRAGLEEGDVVVTTGAEALFGEEFRWQIPREEEEEESD